MTITLYWWMLPLVLALVPFAVAALIRDDPYDVAAGLTAIVCWGTAIGVLIGHYL